MDYYRKCTKYYNLEINENILVKMSIYIGSLKFLKNHRFINLQEQIQMRDSDLKKRCLNCQQSCYIFQMT